MITTGIITSIHGAPSMAEYGFSLVFIYLLVALVFLLPSALISAELATGWPEDGGVYVWVKEAFGERLGFVAVWLQWIENVIWFPSILTVMVVAATYAFMPQLKDDQLFIFISINVLFWALTITNLFGMKTSGFVAIICTLFGRIIPILFLFLLAMLFVGNGNPSQVDFSWEGFVPDLGDTEKLSFIVGAFLTFAGIEASASNAASARNPRRDYPIAILTSPRSPWCSSLSSDWPSRSSCLPAVESRCRTDAGDHDPARAEQPRMVILPAGLIIALGMLGEVNNWIPAPTRGLLVGQDGALPPFLQKENRHAAHQPILIVEPRSSR